LGKGVLHDYARLLVERQFDGIAAIAEKL